MRVSSGRRAGRTHRQRDVPCQDASAVLRLPEPDSVVVAVADGLGTRPQSHIGSQAACDAAVQHLATEASWDEPAVRRSFRAAHESLAAKAAELGIAPGDLASTLQLAGVTRERVVAAIVGDGAVVACPDEPRILLAPEPSEYANEVVPLTEPAWTDHFRYTELDAPRSVFVFTDGLTRLILERTKANWQPFRPFFDAFLPTLRGTPFDEDIVPRFLDGERIDASWDDDKCLVVVDLEDPPR